DSIAAASSSATTSVSVSSSPGSIPARSARSAVLMRLPLCASANPEVPCEPHVLHDGDGLVVGPRHPRGLLAAVLERVEGVEDEPRDLAPRVGHRDDAARLLHLVTGPTGPRRSRGACRLSLA